MPRPTLSHLSDSELIKSLVALSRHERQTTLDILFHLNEMEKRKLHLKQGYGSLFDYCVKRLLYSESAAGRRIQAARALRRFPEIGDLFLAGEVNLMSIAMIAGLLTDDNHADLLSRIRGKSRREVEAIVARHRPVSALPDRVQPVCIRLPEPQPTPTGGSGPVVRDTGTMTCENRSFDSAPAMPRMIQKHLLRFAVGDDFMNKLEELRSLLSHKFPGATLEQILETAMDAYLDRHSHKRRKHSAPRARPVAAGEDASSRARYIAPAVRDAVFKRDGGTCIYKAADGRRCQSTQNLQIDHVIPFARGGANDASNLRLLCAKHNRLEAERIYGDGFRFQRE